MLGFCWSPTAKPGKSLLCSVMTLSELSWRVSTRHMADWSISITAFVISRHRTRSVLLIGRDVASLADGQHNPTRLYLCVCCRCVTCGCETRLEDEKYEHRQTDSVRVERGRENVCLHEGSIANLELNLVCVVYSVSVLPPCCWLLPHKENNNRLCLTKSSSDLGANGSIRGESAQRGRQKDDLFQPQETWRSEAFKSFSCLFTLRAILFFTVRLVKTHQDRLANYFNKTITSPADVKRITLYSSAIILRMDQSTRFHTKYFKASCYC